MAQAYRAHRGPIGRCTNRRSLLSLVWKGCKLLSGKVANFLLWKDCKLPFVSVGYNTSYRLPTLACRLSDRPAPMNSDWQGPCRFIKYILDESVSRQVSKNEPRTTSAALHVLVNPFLTSDGVPSPPPSRSAARSAPAGRRHGPPAGTTPVATSRSRSRTGKVRTAACLLDALPQLSRGRAINPRQRGSLRREWARSENEKKHGAGPA